MRIRSCIGAMALTALVVGCGGGDSSAQTVTVTGVEENDADGNDESVTVTHAVSGYGSVTSAMNVSVTVDDNDALLLASTENGRDFWDFENIYSRPRGTAGGTVLPPPQPPAGADDHGNDDVLRRKRLAAGCLVGAQRILASRRVKNELRV